MTAIRIVILCLTGAMICAMLRVQRPEIAMAISLAIGLSALLLTGESFQAVLTGIRKFAETAGSGGDSSALIVKAAGIVIIAELGVQICSDAGESALAGRIHLAVRVVLLGMAMPLLMQITENLDALFSWR